MSCLKESVQRLLQPNKKFTSRDVGWGARFAAHPTSISAPSRSRLGCSTEPLSQDREGIPLYISIANVCQIWIVVISVTRGLQLEDVHKPLKAMDGFHRATGMCLASLWTSSSCKHRRRWWVLMCNAEPGQSPLGTVPYAVPLMQSKGRKINSIKLAFWRNLGIYPRSFKRRDFRRLYFSFYLMLINE